VNRALKALIFGGLILTLWGCGSDDPAPLTGDSSSDQVIDRFASSEQTYETLHGKVVGQGKAGEFVEEVWFEPGVGFRREWLSGIDPFGVSNPGDVYIVSDQGFWRIANDRRQYCHYPPPGAPPFLNATGLSFDLAFTTFQVLDVEQVATRPALKINRNIANPGHHLFVDVVTGVLLKQEWLPEQNEVLAAEFESIEYDAELDPTIFEADVPSDYAELSCEQLYPPIESLQ